MIDNILSVVYDSYMRMNPTEMKRFYSNTIANLRSYYKSLKPVAVPLFPSVIYVPNCMNTELQIEINESEMQDKKNPTVDTITTPRDINITKS